MTIIFPMAGQSPLMGFKFRPFLPADHETQIQSAFGSFSLWLNRIKRIVFVCLKEQEVEFDVPRRLAELLPGIKFEVISLAAPTKGPFDTVYQAIELARISGPGFICDSDHSLDLSPLFNYLEEHPDLDCLIPTWSLRSEDLRYWSVAAVDDGGRVIAIAEKSLPEVTGHFVGMIGCTYFKDLRRLVDCPLDIRHPYVSDAIRAELSKKKTVHAVKLERACFFGDSARRRSGRRPYVPPKGTIFCDLDGTLVRHQDIPSYTKPLELLPRTLEKMQAWREAGFQIFIATSRPEAESGQLKRTLESSGIRYDKLVMGLPSGPRYVINDRKPSARFVKQAHAFEIERDGGIQGLELPTEKNVHALKRFKGGSLAETLLIEDDEKLFIRKRVSKRENLSSGYGKLKQQYRTIERFSKICADLVPAPYAEHEDSFEYYFDMEYLPRHKMLCECSQENQRNPLNALLELFQERIYSQRADASAGGVEWLEEHVATKIYAKLDGLKKHERLARLISGPPVRLDGEPVRTLLSSLGILMSPGQARRFAPSFLSMVHGDLTFSNILAGELGTRVIDMDANIYYEAAELDLGKLFQSLVGRYEEWEHIQGLLVQTSGNDDFERIVQVARPNDLLLAGVLDRWAEILKLTPEEVYCKGSFYMGLHFLRMVPYRLQLSEEQAFFALMCAVMWLSKLADGNDGCELRSK